MKRKPKSAPTQMANGLNQLDGRSAEEIGADGRSWLRSCSRVHVVPLLSVATNVAYFMPHTGAQMRAWTQDVNDNEE